MPTSTAKKKPVAKPSKTSKTRKPTKAEVAKADELRHIETLKADVGRKFINWRKWNPTANLGELLQFLERAKDELFSFNDDDVLVEIESELSDAADWLATWGPIESHVDGDGEPATVGYRVEELEEDIGEVEELIEALGESFSVKRLPKWKPRTKAS
jgi:hypothetical protein